ncbi:MAG: YqgE/AlgH family protein [Candidatus Symbiobacter sp.]|nr:YqgE/AlgH family protein [Candidatus Symbiobacter sp.]
MTKLSKLDVLTAGTIGLELRDTMPEPKNAISIPPGSFSGTLLVAMPQLSDKRFHRAVIYLCSHNAEGAMGIVINRLASSINYDSLMAELGIEPSNSNQDRPVFIGGPVEPSRGFVLHTADHIESATLIIANPPRQISDPHSAPNSGRKLGLTATTDMLRAIQQGKGPTRNILALGHAGWGPGQLESELQSNSWLTVAADEDIIFGGDVASKWKRALGKLGIDPAMLSSEMGRA